MKNIVIKEVENRNAHTTYHGLRDGKHYITITIPKIKGFSIHGCISLAEGHGLNGMLHTIRPSTVGKINESNDPLSRLQKYIDNLSKWNEIKAHYSEKYEGEELKSAGLLIRDKRWAKEAYFYNQKNKPLCGNFRTPEELDNDFNVLVISGERDEIRRLAKSIHEKVGGRVEATRCDTSKKSRVLESFELQF